MPNERDKSLRETLEDAYEAAVAPVRDRFSLRALVVFIFSEGFGVPLAIAGGDHAVKFEILPALIGFGFGVPLMATGFIFLFWEQRIAETTRERMRAVAYRWLPVAVLLAFAYAVGPNIYQRAIGGVPSQPVETPRGAAPHSPSASEQQLRADLDYARQQLAEAHQDLENTMQHSATVLSDTKKQLDLAQLKLRCFPPAKFAAMVNDLARSPQLNLLPNTYIVVTAEADTEWVRDYIAQALNTAFGERGAKSPLWLMQLPDNKTDLDAPTVGAEPRPGVTIEAKDGMKDFLVNFFDTNGFVVRSTRDTPDPLLTYLQNHNPPIWHADNIAWISIGPGNPWARCAAS